MMMQENQAQQTEENKDRHPLVTLGIYTYKHRQEILDEGQYLGNQGKNLFKKSQHLSSSI
jgi:hypothetical protein